VSRRRSARTTIRDERVRPASDLACRNVHADAPNRLWVADITHVPTWAGFLYLAVVLHAFWRRIVGSPPAHDLRTRLVVDAINMALTRAAADERDPPFRPRIAAHVRGLWPAPQGGRRAPLHGLGRRRMRQRQCRESVAAPLEREGLDRRKVPTKAEARMAVFSFIEGWRNPGRRHSALGYKSPMDHERSVQALTQIASP